MRTNQGGFTLLELVVTLIILGLMLGMGLPAMTRMTQGAAVRAASNELVRDFNIARSHSSDLNERITLCRRSGTSTNCIGASNGAGWDNNGWVIFVDNDQDAIPDVANQFIRITDPIDAVSIRHNGVTGNQFNGSVRFYPDGTVRDINGNLATVDFDLCPNNPSAGGRTIDMNSRGNIRVSTAQALANGRGCP
ncbi:MAG: GspH/FimT family pseudopilin [Granulosicoccaceae bacterium]